MLIKTRLSRVHDTVGCSTVSRDHESQLPDSNRTLNRPANLAVVDFRHLVVDKADLRMKCCRKTAHGRVYPLPQSRERMDGIPASELGLHNPASIRGTATCYVLRNVFSFRRAILALGVLRKTCNCRSNSDFRFRVPLQYCANVRTVSQRTIRPPPLPPCTYWS